MSLLGKIFAILNILAAVGFVVVAGMDWGQRERWAYAVYRHDLLVAGLPIDAQERDPDGIPRVDKLSPQTLNALEPSNTGTQARTQEEEVKRVRGLVDAKINGNDVPGTKSQKLARYLRPLARTARERDELGQKMVAPPPKDLADAEKLEKQLETQFDHEFDGVKESAGHQRSIQERKENAARLLVCLGEALHEDANVDYFTSPAYKRFVNVVGLTGAARAANDQSDVIQTMTQEAASAYDAEQKQFINDLDQAIYRTQNLADSVDRQDRFLKLKQGEVAKAKLLVQARTDQINSLKEQLAVLQGKTAKSLADQAKAEQEVMDRLIDLRDTGKKNQELEREIRRLEGVK